MRQTPLTCSGHTRPVVHLSFSEITEHGYFMISACKGGISQPAVAKVSSRRYYSCEIKVPSRRHLIKKICGTGKTAL